MGNGVYSPTLLLTPPSPWLSFHFLMGISDTNSVCKYAVRRLKPTSLQKSTALLMPTIGYPKVRIPALANALACIQDSVAGRAERGYALRLVCVICMIFRSRGSQRFLTWDVFEMFCPSQGSQGCKAPKRLCTATAPRAVPATARYTPTPDQTSPSPFCGR